MQAKQKFGRFLAQAYIYGPLLLKSNLFKHIQWNPREVNSLEVNSRLKSTPHGGPDFILLCLSNFISLKVNLLGPILA